jgi:hypothetical protein
MNIIVSAFLTNINKNDKSIQTYIDLGCKLLLEQTNSLKIVFIERYIYNTHFNGGTTHCSFEYENKQFDFVIDKNIIFVFFAKTDNYLYNYTNLITQFNVHTDNPGKDTVDYMFVQCHKTEWVKMAIHLTRHITRESSSSMLNFKLNYNLYDDHLQFIWVDFGIYHMFNNDAELFQNGFEHLTLSNNSSTNKVRIASCINLENTYHRDIYNYVAWYFAGSVFGGSPEILLRFAELMKMECISIIQERNHLMWEVNIWYLIYKKNLDMFDPYLCNHNSTIIMNYNI